MAFQSQSENSCDSVAPTPSPCPQPGSVPSTPAPPTTSPSPTTQTVPSSSATSNNPASPDSFRVIPITLIDLDHERNARLQFDPASIRRLRDQIATSGLINPITVRADGIRYRLIAGLNRLEAFRLLQRTEIPAHVVNTDDTGACTIRLTENLTRTNLTPIEEAAQLHDLVEATPGGVDVVAATIGRPVPWVLDRLEILSWDVELQQAVHDKKISASAAKRLARISDPESRRNYIRQAAVHGINTRTAALWLQDANALSLSPPTSSENSIPNPISQNPPETRIQCFTCGTKYNIIDTHPVRLCSTCIKTIQTSCLQGPDEEKGIPNAVSTPNTPGSEGS